MPCRNDPRFREAVTRIAYRDECGRAQEVSLDRAARLPFERSTPIREPRSYKGKRGMVGRAHFATSGRSVVVDSRIELDHVRWCDFDPLVEDLAAQPFRIVADGWTHVPDFFERLADGSARVCDVKPIGQQEDEANRLVFEKTKDICDALDWAYSVEGELPEPLRTNLRLLAGFRRRPFDPGGLLNAIVEACEEERTIAELDSLHPVRALVRPAILHLIWSHVLTCDIDTRLLDRETLVIVGAGEADGA